MLGNACRDAFGTRSSFVKLSCFLVNLGGWGRFQVTNVVSELEGASPVIALLYWKMYIALQRWEIRKYSKITRKWWLLNIY